MRLWLSLFAVISLSRCAAPPGYVEDAGPDAATVDLDGGSDAGFDAGLDAGAIDGGSPDAAVPDDAGTGDAGTDDAGAADAGADAGTDDAGAADAGADAGTADAGFDAGRPLDAQGCLFPDGLEPPFHLRAVAANLTSGNFQSYDPGEGQRILQGLAPDIVLIQEFNYGTNSVAELDAFVAATFDGGFAYTRGFGQIPNGVISRWPLLAQGQWTDPQVGNRTFVWAKVDLPGPRDLWAVSLHLLTTSASNRDAEARALVAFLAAAVPPEDFLLLGGDFNTGGRQEAAVGTLSARVLTAGPWPVDQQGLGGTNAGRDKPYDWVLASPCLQRDQVPVALGAAQYDAGLVVDTRVYTPIGDLAPALATDSAAPQMQHMAVVRDFVVAP